MIENIDAEEINELAKALSAFQGEMKSVAFDKENPYFKSKYATLSAIVSQASPVLAKHGLSVTQLLDEETVITVLLHSSGQKLISKICIKPTKNDAQGIGSAITYARRYSYSAILGIVSDEDDDGNSAVERKALESAKHAVLQPIAKSEVKPLSNTNKLPEDNPGKDFDDTKGTFETITEKEGKNLLAIAKANGYEKENVIAFAKTLGYERLSQLNRMDYEDTLSFFADKTKEEREKNK